MKKNKKQVAVLLSQEQKEKIDQRAEQMNLSRSQYMRSLIDLGVEIYANAPGIALGLFEIQRALDTINSENVAEQKKVMENCIKQLYGLCAKEEK